MTIDWQYPEPRQGFHGIFDKFVGPGATRAEVLLQLGVPLVAALLAPLYAWTLSIEWTALQVVVCAVLAFDIAGGVITNATSSAKRWYDRQGHTKAGLPGFVAPHLLHILLVSWVYLSFDLVWVLYIFGYLLVASALAVAAPLYLQRPVSLLLFGIALLLSLSVLEAPPGLEWFLPLFYLKLLASHLVREEPYRPVNRAQGQQSGTTRASSRSR